MLGRAIRSEKARVCGFGPCFLEGGETGLGEIEREGGGLER